MGCRATQNSREKFVRYFFTNFFILDNLPVFFLIISPCRFVSNLIYNPWNVWQNWFSISLASPKKINLHFFHSRSNVIKCQTSSGPTVIPQGLRQPERPSRSLSCSMQWPPPSPGGVCFGRGWYGVQNGWTPLNTITIFNDQGDFWLKFFSAIIRITSTKIWLFSF